MNDLRETTWVNTGMNVLNYLSQTVLILIVSVVYDFTKGKWKMFIMELAWR